MVEEHDGEVQVKWLDWLSTKGEREAMESQYCTFAGMSKDIPIEIKTRLGITRYPAKYCKIFEA